MYLLETGVVLLLAPWSTFWERNLLVDTLPVFGGVAQWAAVRGAVSGVGAVTISAGAWELVAWMRASIRRFRLRGQTAPDAGPVVPAPSEDTPCTPER